MGATFVSVRFDACSEEELKQHFAAHQDSCRHEDGHSGYSGHIGQARGLKILNQVYKDEDSAINWLEDNTEKWETAKAVKVGDFTKSFPKTAAEKKLVSQYNELNSSLRNWDSNLISRVKAGKSSTRGCDKCTCKIAVKFLKSCYCPVCGNDKYLQTATDLKNRIALNKKVIELNKKIKELKANNKNVAYWQIGAWVGI